MKAHLTAAVLLVVFCPLAGAAAPDQATHLVERALAADSRGDAGQREALLRQALRVGPDFELAHWLLGEVRFQGSWRSIESIGQLVSHDPRWRDYHSRLSGIDGGALGHADLARWCREKGLENEAKWHWYQVLSSDPENKEALGNLHVKHYQGGYYTAQQIEAFSQSRAQAKQDYKRFRREFKTLVNSVEHMKGDQREKALATLAAVRDPAAIEALMATLVDASREEPPADVGEPVCQSIVAALSEMREHAATLKLVEVAIYAPQATVRRSAAEGLRYREPTDFMPILMANLAAPVESTFSVNVAPSGHVTLVESLYEEGPLSAKSQLRSTNYFTQSTVRTFDRRQFDLNTGKELPQTSTVRAYTNPVGDFRRAENRAVKTEVAVSQENRNRLEWNKRMQEVLEVVTDQRLGPDAAAWWDSWKQYNELYTPEELPVEESYNQESVQRVSYIEHRPMSCFVAGTPVWTQAGSKPIEQIVVGEFVLSQDAHSGRLEYRPVIETTVRPPTDLVELSIGDEKIETTRGHRFWVAGDGWQMAKVLKPGSMLLSTTGPREISEVQEREAATAYNLVVADYHTYFVGENRLLVHDNNCPMPTTASVLGAAEASGASK